MFDFVRSLLRPTRRHSIFRADRAGTASSARALTGVIVCLVVTALLSSERLLTMADRQEFGPNRDRWLAAAELLDDVASGVGLDRPASAIDEALGRQEGPSEIVLGDLSMATTTSTPAPTATTAETTAPVTTAPVATTRSTVPTTTPTTPPSTEPTTTAPPVLGEASINEPLRIWVGGDSLGEYVGSQLLYQVAEPDLSEVELDFAISTGLARPDYFDWPARLSEVMQRTEGRPQVVVFMVGGNDDQDMLVDGERAVVGTDAWRVAYRQRVGQMMDIAAYEEVQMLWINLPPMRDGRRADIAADINAALEAEAAVRPWAQVVDIVDLFTGPEGGYEQFLDEPGGDATRKARANDGIHITRTASGWVAEMIWAEVSQRWTFDHDAVPTTTTTAPSTTTPSTTASTTTTAPG